MCLIRPEVTLDGQLFLTASGMPRIQANSTKESERNQFEVDVWDEKGIGFEESQESSDWISDFLVIPVLLLRLAPDSVHPLEPQAIARLDDDVELQVKNSVGTFSFSFHFMIVGQKSLDWLNEKFKSDWPSSSEKPLHIERFRPNLVVTGSDEFEEDQWKKFRIAPQLKLDSQSNPNTDNESHRDTSLVFYAVAPCTRCSMPAIDQNTAVCNLQVVRTLRRHRSGIEDGDTNGRTRNFFGTYFVVKTNLNEHNSSNIAVGDRLIIEDTLRSPMFAPIIDLSDE